MSDNKFPLYWDWIRSEAKFIKSDGCTLVSELFRKCCLQHDLAYYYAKDPRDAYLKMLLGHTDNWSVASSITRKQADGQFKSCIRGCSKLGKWSPIGLVRWLGVRIGAQSAWNTHRAREQKESAHAIL